ARLVIQTDEGAATLNITPDSVTVAEQDGASAAHSWPGDRLSVRLPQTALARLALGAFPPADLLARLDHPVDGAARELLEALFPLRHPHMHYPDRY
ncbi:MAG: hypothetical protein ACRDI2_26160, partial [Chloroflexota bacterium]